MKLSNCKEFYYWIFFPFSLQFCIQFIDRVNVYILFCIFTIREGMDLDFLNCSVIFYCLPLLHLSIYAVQCIKNQSKCGNQQRFPFSFCKSMTGQTYEYCKYVTMLHNIYSNLRHACLHPVLKMCPWPWLCWEVSTLDRLEVIILIVQLRSVASLLSTPYNRQLCPL